MSQELLLKTKHSFRLYHRLSSWRFDADRTFDGICRLLHLRMDMSVWLWNHLLDTVFDPAHHAVNHTNKPSGTGNDD